ncbi:hypothetical protein WH96_20270 [Kiloniella spongiae]|uniref:Type II/III secretion system secretin-like domain-containing protein n=2 Tax=Kiloniella spongiae TaxID=1489064 RepID=A0A0H2M8X2_9PROT|nr:hypothetical protein WH96_20270 [Kiloniella spongiae]
MTAMLVPVIISGCVTDSLSGSQTRTIESEELTSLMTELPGDRLNDPFIRAGVKSLQGGDYLEASSAFNRALKFDPTNPNLHFLNGLTYHLRAEKGDSSQYDFAKAGYDLALRYDSGNYWAAYLQGQIMVREQNYSKAQDAFAYALLNAPDNIIILKALASASYFAQDLVVAAQTIDRAAELAPDDQDIRYNRALIKAAVEKFDEAETEFAVYRDNASSFENVRIDRLSRRLEDWRRFHTEKPYLQKAQFSTNDLFSDGNNYGYSNSYNNDYSSDSNSNTDTTPTDPNKPVVIPEMALVDVVIIRSEERKQTNKGVNLLSGLNATLGGETLSFNKTDQFKGGFQSTSSLTWAPTLSIASSAYSLNIFNDNNDRNEVLARPTLTTLDGEKSHFFSGAVWHVELNGVAGSEGSVTDIPVGIKLTVTPNFLKKDLLKLNVQASRSFIEARSSSAGFDNFSQTTRTTVEASVVLKYNETLVLSGLSERETEKLRDGVPLLQDLPGIQYLFSTKSTLDFTKSVIILLTPRKPRYTYADGTDKFEPTVDQKTEQPHLKKLEGRADWFQPASNLDAVFYHLNDGSFFQEFRQGDLTVERWSQPDRVSKMVTDTLKLLYF